MITAARYLGVAPWELSRQPITWLAYAEAAMDAENRAERELQKRAERRARVRGA